MDKNVMAFTVYMIHEIASAKGLSPSQVYQTLKQYGCIDQYLIPHYEVLHTIGTQYLVDDIGQYVSARGGTL